MVDIPQQIPERSDDAGVVLRVLTSTDEVLADRHVHGTALGGAGIVDALKARVWAFEHPQEEVWFVAYDAMTGHHLVTMQLHPLAGRQLARQAAPDD